MPFPPMKDYMISDAQLIRLLEEEKNIPYVYDDKFYPPRPLTSYESARGTPTIGMGLAILSQADRDLYRPYLKGNKADINWLNRQNMRRIAEFEAILNKRIGQTPMHQNMFDAIFSLAWNCGAYSDIVKRVVAYTQAGDYETAAYEIENGPRTQDGKVSQNLVDRRKREADLYRRGIPQEGMTHPGVMLADVPPPPPVWKQPLFWILSAMSVTVLVLASLRIRRQMRELEQLRFNPYEDDEDSYDEDDDSYDEEEVDEEYEVDETDETETTEE